MKKTTFFPKTFLGKASVALQMCFVAAIIVSVILVYGLKMLSYEDQWWSITTLVAFPASIIAYITGIKAVRRYKDYSVLGLISIIIGMSVIAFVVFQRIFMNN
jgi:phosphatidylglycerophosphate synthase